MNRQELLVYLVIFIVCTSVIGGFVTSCHLAHKRGLKVQSVRDLGRIESTARHTSFWGSETEIHTSDGHSFIVGGTPVVLVGDAVVLTTRRSGAQMISVNGTSYRVGRYR